MAGNFSLSENSLKSINKVLFDCFSLSDAFENDNSRFSLANALLLVVEASLRAGVIISRHFGSLEKGDVLVKDDKSLVTVADLEADKIIKERLSPLFSAGYGLLDEESEGSNSANGFLLVVDPLDGTTNFSIRVPFFNTSIALFRNNNPFFGVVFNPVSKELFVAVKGRGSWKLLLSDEGVVLGQKRLLVSGIDPFKGVSAFCHNNSVEGILGASRLFSAFKKKNPKYRQLGSAALELSLVADNVLASFNMSGVNLWDVGAGVLVASEAGAVVSDFEGNPFSASSSSLIVAGKDYFDDLRRFIKESIDS